MEYKDAVDDFQRRYFGALFDETGADIDEICRRSGYTRKGLHSLALRMGFPWSSA
jgi:hypothetical protein